MLGEIEGDRCPSEWQEESGPLLTVVPVSNYLQGVLHAFSLLPADIYNPQVQSVEGIA